MFPAELNDGTRNVADKGIIRVPINRGSCVRVAAGSSAADRRHLDYRHGGGRDSNLCGGDSVVG